MTATALAPAETYRIQRRRLAEQTARDDLHALINEAEVNLRIAFLADSDLDTEDRHAAYERLCDAIGRLDTIRAACDQADTNPGREQLEHAADAARAEALDELVGMA
jgi:hypothetical protein